MPEQITIRIPRKGGPRALYSEVAHKLLASLGDVQIRRASRVEPTDSLSQEARTWLNEEQARNCLDIGQLPPNKWWADLAPVVGPVLGPFETREEALRAELEWLHANGLPFPLDARDWAELEQINACPCGGRCKPPTGSSEAACAAIEYARRVGQD